MRKRKPRFKKKSQLSPPERWRDARITERYKRLWRKCFISGEKNPFTPRQMFRAYGVSVLVDPDISPNEIFGDDKAIKAIVGLPKHYVHLTELFGEKIDPNDTEETERHCIFMNWIQHLGYNAAVVRKKIPESNSEVFMIPSTIPLPKSDLLACICIPKSYSRQAAEKTASNHKKWFMKVDIDLRGDPRTLKKDMKRLCDVALFVQYELGPKRQRTAREVRAEKAKQKEYADLLKEHLHDWNKTRKTVSDDPRLNALLASLPRARGRRKPTQQPDGQN